MNELAMLIDLAAVGPMARVHELQSAPRCKELDEPSKSRCSCELMAELLLDQARQLD